MGLMRKEVFRRMSTDTGELLLVDDLVNVCKACDKKFAAGRTHKTPAKIMPNLNYFSDR